MTQDNPKKEIAAAECKKDDRTKNDIALAEYKEVVDQFRALTDIRFKLLTYLPLGTVAAAVFVPGQNHLVKYPEISAFAFLATLCIATYDKRNDQLYDELVARSAELERELDIEHGSFRYRPQSWLKYIFVPVDHRWPIGLIYAAAASLWAYLFAAAVGNNQPWPKSLQALLIWLQQRLMWLEPTLMWLKFTAPALVIAGWLGLHLMERYRDKKLKRAVKDLMDQLVKPAGYSQDQLVEKIKNKRILGIDEKKANRRVKYHWKEFERKRDPLAVDSRAASALLAAVIDLPARWIEDVWSGRR